MVKMYMGKQNGSYVRNSDTHAVQIAEQVAQSARGPRVQEGNLLLAVKYATGNITISPLVLEIDRDGRR
jgi:hypothetical protein